MSLADSPPPAYYEPPRESSWCHCDRAFARRAMRHHADDLIPDPDWRAVTEAIEALLDCGRWGRCERCR